MEDRDRKGMTHGHSHAHTHKETKAVLNRMSKIIGHMESVKSMVEMAGLQRGVDTAGGSKVGNQQREPGDLKRSYRSLHCGCGARERHRVD